MPWRRLASAASGEVMKASRARTASARGAFTGMPALKTVTIWIGSGRPPTMADIRGLVSDVLPSVEGDPSIVRVGDEPVDIIRPEQASLTGSLRRERITQHIQIRAGNFLPASTRILLPADDVAIEFAFPLIPMRCFGMDMIL